MIFFHVARQLLERRGATPGVVAELEAAWSTIGALVDVPKPKGAACVACFDGVVFVEGRRLVLVEGDATPPRLADFQPFGDAVGGGRGAFARGWEGLAYLYELQPGHEVLFAPGSKAKAGQALTSGVVSVHALIDILGERAVREELTKQVRALAPALSDAALEAVLGPMLDFVVITDEGHSSLVPGTVLSTADFQAKNGALASAGKRPATARRVVLGWTELAAR